MPALFMPLHQCRGFLYIQAILKLFCGPDISVEDLGDRILFRDIFIVNSLSGKGEKVVKEVMGAVFFENGRILIMRRAPFMSCAGSWEFPGGKLEPGESNEACLARELREELHIDAEIGEFLTENSHGYDFGTVHLSVYRVLSWRGNMELTVHDDMRWVPVKKLATFPDLLPADVPVARALKNLLS